MSAPELTWKRSARRTESTGLFTDFLDDVFGKTQGLQLCRGLAGWQAVQLSVIPIVTASYAATTTFDLNQSSWQRVTLGGNPTLALSNALIGQQFSLILIQGSGGQTVTWFSTIKWASGVIPTLSAGAGAIDIFTFKCYGTGLFYGFAAGQAMA